MARYTDLRQPPAERFAALIERAAEAGRQQATAPHGVVDLGSGDQVWVDETGAHSVRELPDLLDQLGDGLSTTSRANTVSTSPPPASGDGYPDGAIWTVVASDPTAGMVESDRWILQGGVWVQVGLDASRLVVGSVDTGLIDAVALAAQMVTGGLIRTPTSSDGRWLGMSNDGIASYGLDVDGRPSVLSQWSTVSAAANFMSFGRSSISDQGVTAPAGNFNTVSLAGRSLADMIDALPRGLVARYERPTGDQPWRTSWATLIGASWIAEPGRIYRVQTSSFPATANAGGTPHLHMILRGYLAPNGTVFDFYNGESVIGLDWRPMPAMNLTVSAADMGVTDVTGPALVTISLLAESIGAAFKIGSFARPMKMTVSDEGLAIATTVSGDTWTSGSGTTPNKPIIHDMLYRASSGWTNYGIAGATRPASGSWDSNPANLREAWFAFPDMTAELAGSTITGVWIRLTNHSTYWSSGGSAYVGFHGYGALPGSKPTNLTNLIATGWAPGEYKEIPVSPALFAGIKNGSIKGMGITANGNLGTDWYALWEPQPMFRIAHDHY